MPRLLFFVVLVFAIGLGFAWLADRPGEMTVTFNGYEYQVTLMVAAVALLAVVVAVMLAWWLLKAIWNSPYTISRHFRVRRRDRGYQALSTGMIAAGAGDVALARMKKKEAKKLINADQEPLIHLLDVQAMLLEGDHDAAREKLNSMLDDPELRLLALRGLYLEAQRMGERQAARHYAARAAEAAPQLGWASEATLEERAEQGDWDGALKLVDAQKSTRAFSRPVLDRRRAVLLTAKAMAMLDTDPAAARTAALEAVRLAPDFVPATVAAARVLFRHDELRKGARILETLWKKQPHPELADAYVHARPGDSARDRLTRARKLQSMRENNAIALFAVARAALEAGEYRQAREAAEDVLKLDPREGAYLLMADIEEAETGEQGKVRQWLARALRAARDPAWVADGYVAEKWAPFSPVTGRLDAFEWRVPMERVAQTIEQSASAELPALPAVEPDEPAAKVIEAEQVEEAAPEAREAEATAPAPADALPAENHEKAVPAPAASPAAGIMLRRPPDDPGVETEPAKENASSLRLF